VVIKYGGTMGSLWNFALVAMPIMHTVNINAELSHVELYLSETHKRVSMGGTMTEVQKEGDFEAGVVGLILGVFPVLGLAAVVGSIVWKVRIRRARRKAVAA